MKLRALLNEITKEKALLTEIGDTTDTYKYVVGNLQQVRPDDPTFFKSKNVFFADDGEQYKVTIEAYGSEDEETGEFEWLPTVDASFTAKSTGFGAVGGKLSKQTFKVMATVVRIIKDFIEKHKFVQSIKFDVSDPSKGDTTAKTKLYMAFIKKQMPNAEVVRTGGYYKINLKEFTRDLYNRKGIEGAEDYQWHHPTDVDHPIQPDDYDSNMRLPTTNRRRSSMKPHF